MLKRLKWFSFTAGATSAVLTALVLGQDPAAPSPVGPAPLSPLPHPNGYVCYRADGKLKIDGRMDESAWDVIPWTETFVDIEGDRKPLPRHMTRAKMAWDEDYFYIAAWMDEPHVWATLTEHDSVIFRDNDFEVFIDPDGDNHDYFEFEINALNTGWDLFLPRPYKDGGKADNSWEIPGLLTAVHVDGTLNNPADTDRGWSVEMAFPWKAFERSAGAALPPRNGDRWRVNFSRVQWRLQVTGGRYEKLPGLREDNWVWSPQYAINMHRPETWGYVEFTTARAPSKSFEKDPLWPVKEQLHAMYYAQREHRRTQGRFAATLEELGAAASKIRLETTGTGFLLHLPPCMLSEISLLRCRTP